MLTRNAEVVALPLVILINAVGVAYYIRQANPIWLSWLFYLIGTLSNAAALFANGFYMPVYGSLDSDGLHIPATATTRLPWLTDWIFDSSPGDICILAGFLMFLMLMALSQQSKAAISADGKSNCE